MGVDFDDNGYAVTEDDKRRRLRSLSEVPLYAAADHRFFLDSKGNDSRVSNLPRAERRKMEAAGRRIGEDYRRIFLGLKKSGAGFPADQLVRQLAIEYTHRYAASGLYNQPLSFNYFEAFCEIRLIDKSYAPYAWPAPEVDHLFSIIDYLDYATGPEGSSFDLSQLKALPDGKAFHFTPNGSILDFTFLTAEGREFFVGGFTMIRHGNSLHWYVLGGAAYSEAEWENLATNQAEFGPENIPAYKRPFLSASMQKNGNKSGKPVTLEGTERALRTIIAAETDLTSCKHVGRCHMEEWEHNFSTISDDPLLFVDIKDAQEREVITRGIHDRVESAAAMWSLGEAMFQLPAYFNFKIQVAQSVPVSEGRKLSAVPKGGRGVGANQFRYVSALEFEDKNAEAVRSFAMPRYDIETEGYWRRLKHDAYGQDAYGNRARGRTWVRESNSWRDRPEPPKVIYVKSTLDAARIRLAEYFAKTEAMEAVASMPTADFGVLYVLRCTVMQEEVYKVGWTSGTAEERAKQLSSATGVPTSFIVVEAWHHTDPAGLERNVHAMLMPYRISAGREFFQVSYGKLKGIIEAEIRRADRA